MKERFDATVEWLPFDLHPEYPPKGVPRNPERAARTAQFFEPHGLVYNPPPVAPRSLDALRLTEHARAQGIGDPDVLHALAAEVGLEGADDVLATDAYADDVRRSTEEAHSVGINGIPAFLLDRRLLVLGAHPKETFERALM